MRLRLQRTAWARRFGAVALGAWLAPGAIAAAASAPADQLSAAYPTLFPVGSLADAAASGERGARIVQASDASRALDLRTDDILLVAGSQRVDCCPDAPLAPQLESPSFVVWRTVPGARPVLPPVVLGRQTLDEFLALPPAERTPMRLAVMLANRATLVREGGGVVIVPAPAPTDAAAWRRAAELLPAGSEAALQDAVRALVERVHLPPPPAGELQEARVQLERRNWIEAEERARRALLAVVADPARRAERDEFDPAVTTFLAARDGAREHQARLLAPEPRLGFLLESRAGRIQALLPQHTLLQVDNATSLGFAAGIRIGWPFGPLRVIDDISLVVQYGQTRTGFAHPDSGEVLDTTLHEVNVELLYRPRVASRLKPYLRAGAGIHTIDAQIHCNYGPALPAFERTAPAFLFGGGIDVLRWQAAHARVSIGGAYRLVDFTFPIEFAPSIEPCRNTLDTFNLDVDGRGDRYRFDLSGWQAGVVLAIEP